MDTFGVCLILVMVVLAIITMWQDVEAQEGLWWVIHWLIVYPFWILPGKIRRKIRLKNQRK
jgi:hypothetical protein